MKKLGITLMLAVIAITFSSCDKDHFWSVLSGSRWYADYAVQGNWEKSLHETDLEYMEIIFHTNGRGEVGFYDDYGYWGEYGFYWEENDRNGTVRLVYDNGGTDYYYYDYRNGRLYLSRDANFYNYIEFSH